MRYVVYILYSESCEVYYKGYSENVAQRLWEHNNDLSRYTKGKGPWRIVFTKVFQTKKEALIFERKIKRLNKVSLEKLIDSNNPVDSGSVV